LLIQSVFQRLGLKERFLIIKDSEFSSVIVKYVARLFCVNESIRSDSNRHTTHYYQTTSTNAVKICVQCTNEPVESWVL